MSWDRTGDVVNHPAHYTQGHVECIDGLESALGQAGFLAYCVGNAIKYLWRASLKGNEYEDLKKAAWYVARALEAYTKSPANKPETPPAQACAKAGGGA